MKELNSLLWQTLASALFCAFSACPATAFDYSPANYSKNNKTLSGFLSNRDEADNNYAIDLASDGFYIWPRENFPLKVYLRPGDDIPGFRQSFVSVLRSCFDNWASISDGKLSWKEVGDPSSADIVVTWSNNAHEARQGTEAGKTRLYARYNTKTHWGLIEKAEINLLTRLPEREFSSDEILKAYLHEVGHAIGIAGHSKNKADIMYFAVSPKQSGNLSSADIGTLHFLYKQQPNQNEISSGGTNAEKITLQSPNQQLN